jgi:hypothetical protein
VGAIIASGATTAVRPHPSTGLPFFTVGASTAVGAPTWPSFFDSSMGEAPYSSSFLDSYMCGAPYWSAQHTFLVAPQYGFLVQQVGPSFTPPLAPLPPPQQSPPSTLWFKEWDPQSLTDYFSSTMPTPPVPS